MTAAEVLNLKISTHAPRVRRDNVCKVRLLLNHQDFYSRASCEARLGVGRNTRIWCISTHAPRVRRDGYAIFAFFRMMISTHAPRVRRDLFIANIPFISRISTHAPRVRRDIDEAQEYTDDQISTHAPRVRRDETWSPGRL